MATYCLTSTSLHSHPSSSSQSMCKSKSNPPDSFISSNRCTYRKDTSFLNSQLSSSSSSFTLCPKNPVTSREVFTVSAVVEGEQPQFSSEPDITGNGYSLQEDSNFRNSFKPYELYVCNLPRSCDIPELLNQFKTFGTVQSVEVLLSSLIPSSISLSSPPPVRRNSSTKHDINYLQNKSCLLRPSKLPFSFNIIPTLLFNLLTTFICF